jgi:23S rRNA pseudouridine1911/1915/1917 synthase
MPDSEWTAGAGDAGERLDKFLASPQRLGSRGRAAAALERGKIFVNGAEAALADAAHRVADGDVVRFWSDRPGSSKPRPRTGPAADLDVVFEDDDLMVINKPAGILSVPLERKPDAPSVYAQIVARFRSHGKRHPFVVHRIDQNTSGLVVFAKHQDAQQALQAEFKHRDADRLYLAVVYGHPQPPAGTWRDTIVWDARARIQKPAHPRERDRKDAVSEYHVVETFADTSLLEVRLQTGRRNQIRVQASLRGHMLVGEPRYLSRPEPLHPIPFGRQALHAWRLAFLHPADGRRLKFEAPLPGDLADLLTRLRRSSR